MYRIISGPSGETSIVKVREGGGISFTEDPQNPDYQEYLVWIAEGNTPEPWPPAES